MQTSFYNVMYHFIGGIGSCHLHIQKHFFMNFLSGHLYKRCQMCQRNALSTVLAAGYLRNNLCSNITRCRKAVRLIYKRLTDNSSILKHILQINQITVVHVLCKIIRIMEMNQPLLVRLYNILWKQQTSG